MLVTSGLNDSRVAYWEPSKWVARLRERKTDDHPLLLRMNMGAGHGGSSGRYERLKEIAFDYAFMLNQVGLAGVVP
jgi:oligopeptidase B